MMIMLGGPANMLIIVIIMIIMMMMTMMMTMMVNIDYHNTIQPRLYFQYNDHDFDDYHHDHQNN